MERKKCYLELSKYFGIIYNSHYKTFQNTEHIKKQNIHSIGKSIQHIPFQHDALQIPQLSFQWSQNLHFKWLCFKPELALCIFFFKLVFGKTQFPIIATYFIQISLNSDNYLKIYLLRWSREQNTLTGSFILRFSEGVIHTKT